MSEKMRVGVFTGQGKVEVQEVEKPRPGKGQVLVKIGACALCTFEQRMFRGIVHIPFPYVGGHEVSGIIEELGERVDVNRWKPGQKVSLRLLENCGECYYCRTKREDLCENIGRKVENGLPFAGIGGLSEYLLVEPRKLFKVADDLPFEVAALTEPLACVVHSVEKANIEFSNDVVVIGAGIMGLFHLILSKNRGARVTVSEVNDERRKLAESFGADYTINPSQVDPVKRIKDLTEGRGADVVFDTVPIIELAQQATQMIGKAGRLVFYTSFSQDPDKTINVSPDWVHHSQVTITGSVNPAVSDFFESSRLLSFRIVRPEPLISQVVPLDRIQEAFEMAINPKNYRVVVRMS